MPTSDTRPSIDGAKMRLRITLADAYTFALSQELTQGVSSMNIESMMQQELARIQGPTNSTIYRPVLERLRSLKTAVQEAVEEAKELPPEEFMLSVNRTGTNQDV